MGNLKLSIVIAFILKLNIELCRNGQACLLVAINYRIHEFMYVFYRQVTEAHRHQLYQFYIQGSVHRNSILIRSNKMQQYAGIYLLQNYSLHVSVSIAPIIRRS